MKLTDHEAAWLRKLRDEGPQPLDVLYTQFRSATTCLGSGLTEWSGVPSEPEKITAAGLDALAAHEADE